MSKLPRRPRYTFERARKAFSRRLAEPLVAELAEAVDDEADAAAAFGVLEDGRVFLTVAMPPTTLDNQGEISRRLLAALAELQG